MGISQAEFLCHSAQAFRDKPYKRDGNTLILCHEMRHARKSLSPQGDRALASVTLPTTFAAFPFVG